MTKLIARSVTEKYTRVGTPGIGLPRTEALAKYSVILMKSLSYSSIHTKWLVFLRHWKEGYPLSPMANKRRDKHFFHIGWIPYFYSCCTFIWVRLYSSLSQQKAEKLPCFNTKHTFFKLRTMSCISPLEAYKSDCILKMHLENLTVDILRRCPPRNLYSVEGKNPWSRPFDVSWF